MPLSLRVIDVSGQAPQGGTAILARRVLGNNAACVNQAALSAASYSIFAIDPNNPATRNAVTGYQAVSLTIADVIFDTLQLDEFWNTADETPIDNLGYNFRHQPPHAIGSNVAFATAGVTYMVEYTLTPSSGEPILLRFKLTCV